MATRVLMPKGSDTMTEGKVLKWLKQEGDAVATGESILEIETDKVNMEVEALSPGILRKILVAADEVVPVGRTLAVIAGANEDITRVLAEVASEPAVGAPAEPAQPPAAAAVEEKSAVPPAAEPPSPAPAVSAPSAGPAAGVPVGKGRVLASPMARRLAEEKGLDLARIAGTGPGERVIREDVERAAASARAPKAKAVPLSIPPLPPRVPEGPEFQDEPLSSMRKTIASRLVQSLGPVPHFYLTMEVDMQEAKELRESANTLDPELKLTYNDIVIKACAAALRLHPEVNASFRGDAIRRFNRVHIGVAVALEDGGLITPVIRDADGKTLQQISRETKELAARARNRKLLPEEYTGATFSVSNLGMLGIDEFTAVINPPEGAILAVGAVVEKPVVTDGRIEIGCRCRLTMSCDHRVIDGATGAKFLGTFKQILENPVYLAV
jgi:pyruvate dehydrogenase E2 component (dihydrolipoamide acetyltransferase)